MKEWVIIMAIVSVSIIIGFSIGADFVRKNEPEKPAPVGYRYLQKCEDGVTVEYRSFKKLPKLHVCGE